MLVKSIYTLSWLESEAETIASAWNGEDECFAADGVVYTEDQAHAAKELCDKLSEVRELIDELQL